MFIKEINVHKRNKDSKIYLDIFNNTLTFDLKQLKVLLEPYKLTFNKHVKADGLIVITTKEIDAAAGGDSLDKALRNLAKTLLVLTEHYYETFSTRRQMPQTIKFPLLYVLKILLCEDIQEIIDTCIKERN